MPPQIKQDLNRSGWETTDFPSVCESCLPENPYVQMLKSDHGAECKLCTRPYTLFTWKGDRTSRARRTAVCLTCARLKNCCQACMLDLSFGLPIVVRDAALKMVAPGPQSEVNREFFAQNNERALADGKGLEGYEKTDEKARELLRRLATSEPYFRRGRRFGDEDEASAGDEAARAVAGAGGGGGSGGASGSGTTPHTSSYGGLGPIRTRDTARGGGTPRGRGGGGGGARGSRLPPTSHLPPTAADIEPPRDTSITSLFITGIEDDLAEHKLRAFFAPHGTIRSLVCSHLSHCAFVNYASREAAERAAAACQGRAVVAGCPLRVQWGRPRPIGMMDKEERAAVGREGRGAFADVDPRERRNAEGHALAGSSSSMQQQDELARMAAVAPPPGQGSVQYASLSGD